MTKKIDLLPRLRKDIHLKITGFIWIEEIIEKLAKKHHAYQSEVREVFASQPIFRYIEKGHQIGEDVYAAFGQTDSGRRLIVFFVLIVLKNDGRALILSARNMTPAERRKYEHA